MKAGDFFATFSATSAQRRQGKPTQRGQSAWCEPCGRDVPLRDVASDEHGRLYHVGCPNIGRRRK